MQARDVLADVDFAPEAVWTEALEMAAESSEVSIRAERPAHRCVAGLARRGSGLRASSVPRGWRAALDRGLQGPAALCRAACYAVVELARPALRMCGPARSRVPKP
jgi:hypothetical protein